MKNITYFSSKFHTVSSSERIVKICYGLKKLQVNAIKRGTFSETLHGARIRSSVKPTRQSALRTYTTRCRSHPSVLLYCRLV